MDTPEEILRACVDRAGGAKTVGCRLKPELSDRPDIAARWLLDRLNEDRRERLNVGQIILILRMARDAGFHDGMAAWNRLCGYGPASALAPESEAADLQRRFVNQVDVVQKLLGQMKAANVPVEMLEGITP